MPKKAVRWMDARPTFRTEYRFVFFAAGVHVGLLMLKQIPDLVPMHLFGLPALLHTAPGHLLHLLLAVLAVIFVHPAAPKVRIFVATGASAPG